MILLTGATGFIGSHLLSSLSTISKVRCLVHPRSAKKIRPIANVEWLVADLGSGQSFKPALSGVRCVVHLAALLRKNSADEIFRINVTATEQLVQEALDQSVDHFIYLSTENAMREDLGDAYASTKRQAETIVERIKNHLILRPCFVYGPGDNHGLGRIVNLAQKIPVVPQFGGLRSKIQPIYIDDMVQCLLLAVQDKTVGHFVVAGPEEISLNDFVQKVFLIQKQKKIFLPIPHSVLSAIAWLGDTCMPSLGWGKSQMNNIYGSRTYSIAPLVEAFHFKPRNIELGLTDWLLSKGD